MIGVTSCKPQTPKPEPLTREEEYDLILRAKARDPAAQTRLIHQSKGLIMKAVRRYSCSQVDWNILKTAGDMAVLIAISNFDLSKGNRFSTYLVRTIYSEVRDCFCEETGISRQNLDNLGKISKASAALRHELGREATLEEIAEYSELSERQILNALRNKTFAQPRSLNQRFDEDSPEWLDSQIDESADPWGLSEEVEVFDMLDQLESDGYLQSRQVKMLAAKHQGYNNGEIGKQFGVTGERVRQLVKEAHKTLIAFKEDALKLRPKLDETKIPVSAELSATEELKEPVVERVDASRLGGRIGRTINQIFNLTKEGLDDQNGELTHAQKHLLDYGWRCNHRIAPQSGHQFTSTNQRCRGLGGIQEAWGGYLEIGQEILSVFLLPLAFVYLAVRGFQENCMTLTRRASMHSIATDIFKFLGIKHRRGHPRPPDHCPGIDKDSS